MEEKKAQKAFGMRNSRDMLEKLRWELSNLLCRQRHDVLVCQYHTFNCAVTAWHVTDWLWQDISPELKAQQQWKKSQDFHYHVRKHCSALNLCYQVERGARHCLVEHKPDPNISTNMSDGEGYDYGNPIIIDGDKSHDARHAFEVALHWLEEFVRCNNVLPEEPFLSLGDDQIGALHSA